MSTNGNKAVTKNKVVSKKKEKFDLKNTIFWSSFILGLKAIKKHLAS